MAIDIERITDLDRVLTLAPSLADLLKACLTCVPHYRPVTVDEIERRVREDRRFEERSILVAARGGTPVGWCHLEPPGLARTSGDLYPYVGGQVVFQPGLPHVRSGQGCSAVVRALLYAACQVRAQQGAAAVELYAPADCAAEDALRAAAFQPVDYWATYVAPLSAVQAGRAPLNVSAVSDVEQFPGILRDAGLLEGQFASADLFALIASFPGFDAQGLLVARRKGEVVGCAAVMIDQAYVAATGRQRAWLGFGPFGMAAARGPDQQERIRTLVSAAQISAFCRGAGELAFVASAEGRQPSIWGERGFEIEVHWRRWRTEL